MIIDNIDKTISFINATGQKNLTNSLSRVQVYQFLQRDWIEYLGSAD
jgi:3-deoxy-D-arabino-heptulosonate 7-phosphate (DAHP) synthase class II